MDPVVSVSGPRGVDLGTGIDGLSFKRVDFMIVDWTGRGFC